MMLSRRAPSGIAASTTARVLLFTAALLSGAAGSSAALAQAAAGCGDIQPMLSQRKTIGDRITAATSGGKKQIDAKRACTDFGALVSNGQTLLKWVDANRDWCQIPEGFVTGIREDHGRATKIRGQACGAAAKQAQMEKQARDGGSGGGGLLGGAGLSGASRLPQGAL